MYPKGIVGWAIRGSQLFFAIIVLALAGALVANQPSGGAPSQINYAIFVGVFSILAVVAEAQKYGIGFDVVDDLTGSRLGRDALMTFSSQGNSTSSTCR